MAIPAGAILDFNPALRPEVDGAPLTSITLGDLNFLTEGTGATEFTLKVGAAGQRCLSSSKVLVTDTFPNGPEAASWFYVLKVPTGHAGPNTMGHHYATGVGYNYDMAVNPDWNFSSGGDVATTPVVFDVVTTFGMAFAGSDNEAPVYVDGVQLPVLDQSHGYTQAGTPGFLPGGELYRAIWWDRVLTPAEFAQLNTELREPFKPRATITWDAPAHASEPVLGYVVRSLIDGVLKEVELDVDERTVDLVGTGVAQVYARSATGLSAPVEVTF